MNLQESKDNLLKEVITPSGNLILYGINLLPNSEAIGLIFYIDGKQVIYFSIDCTTIQKDDLTIKQQPWIPANPAEQFMKDKGFDYPIKLGNDATGATNEYSLSELLEQYHEAKMKEIPCDHPFAFVHSSCFGEINKCYKCGKDLSDN